MASVDGTAKITFITITILLSITITNVTNDCLLFILAGLLDMSSVAQFAAQHAHISNPFNGSDV